MQTSGSPGAGVEVVTPKADCFWLRGALTVEEQARLFAYVKERDRTDWAHLPRCMNPTPKTLQLAASPDGSAGRAAPTLLHDSASAATPASDAVGAALAALRRGGLPVAGRAAPTPAAFTLAAIRYTEDAGRFPPHVDHCNDGTWVVLFSVGCPARFRVKTPAMDRARELALQSGDAVVFDPSTAAGIVHEVAGIGAGCPGELGASTPELQRCRYGVQCRVQFV